MEEIERYAVKLREAMSRSTKTKPDDLTQANSLHLPN